MDPVPPPLNVRLPNPLVSIAPRPFQAGADKVAPVSQAIVIGRAGAPLPCTVRGVLIVPHKRTVVLAWMRPGPDPQSVGLLNHVTPCALAQLEPFPAPRCCSAT